MICIRLPCLIVIHFPIFTLYFVDAFDFCDVLDGAFSPDDTTKDCDADADDTEAVNAEIVDIAEEE